ncbi:hypothetical protein Golomagni_01665 [Golovinomyces magnicellulatus]|nr:hypothetical protein Golomagni_01665 [Golovinomyces magnicellulatus]
MVRNSGAQNQRLRIVTGGYKRTPRAILEREVEIPPIDLHMRTKAYSYGISTKKRNQSLQIS